MTDAQIWFVFLLFACGVLMLAVALTDEFANVRRSIVERFRGDGLSDIVRKANKERLARRDAHTVEFLTYGFSLDEATKRAAAKMQAEADAATKVTP